MASKRELEELKRFCILLAEGSGTILREYFRSGVAVETKADRTPVTAADLKAEEYLRSAIMREYPGHGILGEEFGTVNEGARYRWVLDPIDGTKSFICGVPLFGTLIALLEEGVPLLGVIHHPVLGELLIGDNESCLLNGRAVRCRQCRDIGDAVLLTTDPRDVPVYQKEARFDELVRRVKVYRTWGDCYGYSLVAAGFADIMVDPVMSPWDSLALIPVIRGAGGIITDFGGDDPVRNSSSIIAASEGLHGTVLEILGGDSARDRS
ncbi:MAG: histidinol-phosphatase [Spirochaetes bacterium]|nr:histidinol-phosphatase [Spirochaetota bacterium]